MGDRIFGNVVIVGPGLIGGSMGMGLRQRSLAGEVVGVGHRRSSLDRAKALGAIDRGTLSLERAVAQADLVLLCTGVALVPELAARAIPLMKRGAILSDVGSAKEQITERIEASLGGSPLAYLGTHPLAGLEKRGVHAARGDLFEGSVCIFTPTRHTAPEARERLAAMWQALGARVREMDAATHDRLLCQVSHLPHLVAAALVNVVGPDALEFAASGFRDTTRIAASDPELWTEIFLSNRDNLSRGLIALLEQIGAFASALERDDRETLLRILGQAKERREGIK